MLFMAALLDEEVSIPMDFISITVFAGKHKYRFVQGGIHSPRTPCGKERPRFRRETGPFASSFYRNRRIPSVAETGSALMVTVNLMLFRSPKLSSQFRKVSVSASTSLPTILQKLSMNMWEMS